ncbi:restriction endonuclease subunit S [Dyella sp.]|uniref:restriction endonuclease subunit S n=1 Tax=Dyella sp. TaxID=1869338 RepID=UPI002FDA0569
MLPESWELSTVGKCCAIKNNLRLPLSTEQREKMKGPFPYFGPTGALGYIDHFRIDEEFALIGEDGDHFLKFKERPMTILFNGKANVNNHAHVIVNSEKCLASWFFYWFMHRDLTSVLSRQGVGRYKLTKAGLEELEIAIPPLEEQYKIVRIFSIWNKTIATTEHLLATTRKQKQAMLARVLTGKRRLRSFVGDAKFRPTPHGTIPEDWSYPKIEEIASEINKRHSEEAPFPVLSCTKHEGLVDSLSYFNKQVFSKDLSTYKIVPRGTFVYATNHIEEGSIGYQDLYDFGLVSPMYTVFNTTNEVHDGYLYRLLKTEHFRQIFEASTNSSVDRRGSLRWNEFKKLHIPLPPMMEQKAIDDVLTHMDREIELLKQQLRKLQMEKSALMQQLLTGKRRVRLPVQTEAIPA